MDEQLDANEEVNNKMIIMRNRSEDLKNATVEQKMAIEEIVNSVNVINENTQVNTQSAEEMNTTISKFTRLSYLLKNDIDFFKK